MTDPSTVYTLKILAGYIGAGVITFLVILFFLFLTYKVFGKN